MISKANIILPITDIRHPLFFFFLVVMLDQKHMELLRVERRKKVIYLVLSLTPNEAEAASASPSPRARQTSVWMETGGLGCLPVPV